MKKKHYHVERKNRADTRALLRGLVCAYLLYLAFRLITQNETVFRLAGGLFAAGAVAFGWFTWKQYRVSLSQAELTPEEEEELRREREEGP